MTMLSADELHKRYLELKSFVEEIYPLLESDQIAQHSVRMDKRRAKLREKAKKLLETSN